MNRLLFKIPALLIVFLIWSQEPITAQVDSLNIIEADTLITAAKDCEGETEVCLDVVFRDLRNYEVFVNNSPYAGRFPACNFDTIYKVNFDNIINNALPPFELIFFEVGNESFQTEFNTFRQLVDSVRVWDSASNWQFDSLNNEMFCVNPSNPDFSSIMRFQDSNDNITTAPIDFSFIANGTFFFFNTGWNQVVFNDTANQLIDTVDIGIYCSNIDTVNLSIDWMQRDTYCFASDELLGSIDSIDQLELISGDQLDWVENDSCLIFTGVLPGLDTFVYRLSDELGIIDTQVVIIEVSEEPTGSNEIITDTIYPAQRDSFCPDLVLEIDSLNNLCPEASGFNVNFEYDSVNNCILYEYVSNGRDSFCLEIIYDNELRDTFTLIITASNPMTETIRDSLFLSESRNYCLERNELQGDSFSLNVFCQDSVFTSLSIDSITYCIEINGDSIGGTDSLCVELCDTSGLCDTTFFVMSVMDNIDSSITFLDSLLLNFTDTICLTNRLPGDIVSAENVCPDSLNEGVRFTLDTASLCVVYTAEELVLDTACVVLRDDLGNTDTNLLVIQPLSPVADTARMFVDFLESDTLCLNGEELAGELVSIANACPGSSSGNVEFTLDTSNYCIRFTALLTGLDTACVVICDSFGVCDTTILIVEVGELPTGDQLIIRDTLYPNQLDSFCFDFEFGFVDTIIDQCDSLNGRAIDFSMNADSSCLIYTYLQEGADTSCIEIIYENGIRDSFTFFITGRRPTTDTILDTLFVNTNINYCLDLTQLAGPVDTAVQFCSDTTIATQVGVISENLCFDVNAVEVGLTDTLCWSYCDSFGICDTSVFILSVRNTIDTSEFIFDTVLINFTDTICFENELPGDLVSIESICPMASGPIAFTVDSSEYCLYYTGESVGADTSCILLRDEFGNTDTNFVVITAMRPTADTIRLEIPINITDTVCIDDSELAGSVNTMINICPDNIGDDVDARLIEGLCIEYTGLVEGGVDTMCILICDDLGICDTAIYIFEVEADSIQTGRDSLIVDSVLINFTETICFDTLDANGPVVSINNECPDQSGEVEFFVDQNQYCLSYTGESLGVDTACIVIEYADGPADSFTVVIHTIPPAPDTTFLDLERGEQLDTCVMNPTEELAGFLMGETVQDICPNANGESVEIQIDTSSLCLDITSISEGVDTICLVYCDNSSVCDTSIFIISVSDTTVITEDRLPVALDDRDTTLQNQTRVINVLGNDTIPSNELTSFDILVLPINGSAFIDTSGLVMYSPNEAFCGEDSFTYEICNEIGCDTATVIIEVQCQENLFIPQGFSPNGDNIGDTWFIEGLDRFPNTSVEVFNRWGNRVFLSNNYQNDWDGTWEGDPLPDGTYFYLIDFRNGEKPESGFVVILR